MEMTLRSQTSILYCFFLLSFCQSSSSSSSPSSPLPSSLVSSSRTKGCIISSSSAKRSAFSFDPKNFFFSQNKNNNNNNNSNKSNTNKLVPGDTIAVLGASGNVGKLVTLRLSDTYKVNGIVRDASSSSSLSSFLWDGPKKPINEIQLFESDLLSLGQDDNNNNDSNDDDAKKKNSKENLVAALENAHGLIICTGTTAFPTKAWLPSSSSSSDITFTVLKTLFQNQFNIPNTMKSLDTQRFNTPNNIDNLATQYVLQQWSKVSKQQQKKVCIMLSSIGVQRRFVKPFSILNTCGVLDAKAAGENAVITSTSLSSSSSYTIIRPGQLFGGPYDNNYYLGTLFQLDKDIQTQNVSMKKGDTLLGDTLRSTLAEVTVQVCELGCASNIDFAVINTKGDFPSLDILKQRLQSL